MPTGIAAARTPRESKRRSRTAVGATAGRIHRAGTSRNTGHWRRAQATIRSSSRLSIGALSPLSIARGYAWAPSTAIMQAPAHDRAHRAIVSEPAPLPLPPDSDTLGSHPMHLRIGRGGGVPADAQLAIAFGGGCCVNRLGRGGAWRRPCAALGGRRIRRWPRSRGLSGRGGRRLVAVELEQVVGGGD
jgi:hypothetical protein